ncbi:hypothetical protein [Streptomyces sp. Tu 3180]|uniref:hypothetical protein n=1 Tax=Streptomyces sp. Tu 3180 TaxID=2682611 RepID=UPI001356C1F1|nr:hypothetical protein [Streptomyces sp. Tu 3180]KAF3466595.1 hypothetical protein GL259_21220 [Streptomyces sp. Tu 3180]
MSDGKDARREEREPQGPRPSGDAREPQGPPAPEGIRESGDAGEPADADGPGDAGEPLGPSGTGDGDRAGDAPDVDGPGGSGGPALPRDAGDSGDLDAPDESRRTRAPEPDGPPDAVPPRKPTWLRGPGKPHGQEPKQSHAGNGTVNHGPDRQGPDEQGPEGFDGLDADELALRTMLHQVVREVEPSDGTLDYLRRAVPARRARKRQALVGMAAAALFVGTAVPAAVHVSNTAGSDANPSAVGHASQTQGGTGDGKGPGNGETTAGGASDQVEGTGKGDKKDEDKGGASTGTSEGATEGADPSSGTEAGASACTADQLGPAVASSAAPDSTGAVYGSFRVTNVSTGSCTVDGPGGVSATPAGAADPARVTSARHVAGDAAAGLPDPSVEVMTLVLAPGEAYEVKFAWVPSEPCSPAGGGTDGGGTGGPSPDPSPTEDPTTTSGASTGTGTGTETGMSTQLVMEDGTADGSVTVTYTAATGSGVGTATVSNACAGTVYWTGLLTGM